MDANFKERKAKFVRALESYLKTINRRSNQMKYDLVKQAIPQVKKAKSILEIIDAMAKVYEDEEDIDE